jgi:predicted MFS family arabinose efflux permease
MQRNLRLFPVYQVLIWLSFWTPVFFLYFSSLFTLEQVLLLEAVYYLSVVVLEIPSGYFSDRVGRKWALLTAALAGVASGCLFAFTRSFTAFCFAQFLYAVFMAFNSGSDTSLLFDSLKSLGREKEALKLEARANSLVFFWGVPAAALAGAVALIGYEWAYVLSAISYGAAAGVALLFREPVQEGPAAEVKLARQLGACIERLRSGSLAWLFAVYVGWVIFEHIPYEFFQPYIGLAIGTDSLPLIVGIHLALTKLAGGFIARRADSLVQRWGAESTLLLTHASNTVMIAAMALWVHPLVVGLLLLRNIPHAIGSPVLHAQIHPQIHSGLRATYLSLQSLVGRLAFGAVLAVLSWWTGPGVQANAAALSRLLLLMAVLSGAWLLALFVGRRR